MAELGLIPVAAPVLGERESQYVNEALRSGWVSSIGPFIDRFEKDFAKFCGVRNGIAVSNGTVALHLALHSLGIGQGDEVIVPDLTFAATAHAVLQVGATPVLVDVEPDTWCLDPVAVEKAISPKTRAIIPVHLFGHPAAIGELRELAAPNGIALVEDAAEAHGATVEGRRVGSLGRIAAFSFYGNKLITCGEGGMLVTDDDVLAERCRHLKDHGMSKARRYYHEELAFNYRMTNLQAALGVAQLERVEDFIAKKRQIVQWYREALDGIAGLRLNVERRGSASVYWMVGAVLGDQFERGKVCSQLRLAGIDTRPFFVPMSELPHLRGMRRVGRSGQETPVAAGLGRSAFNLPSGCGLEWSQVNYIGQVLRRILAGS